VTDMLTPVDTQLTPDQLERAIQVLTSKAIASSDPRESKEYAQAILAMAQAIVLLDPEVDTTGVPLEHHVDLERTRQDGALRLEQARQSAAAPTPSRRSVAVRRDAHGRATGYDVAEG
jgi:hypothetical protein